VGGGKVQKHYLLGVKKLSLPPGGRRRRKVLGLGKKEGGYNTIRRREGDRGRNRKIISRKEASSLFIRGENTNQVRKIH